MMSYRNLADGMANWLVAPKFQAILHGVASARQNNRGTVTLTYVDGTTEPAECPEFELSAHEECFVAAIEAVQGKRGR